MTDATSATIGPFTLQQSQGFIYYIKMDANGNVIYAANTGPTQSNVYMIPGTITAAPETNEVFLSGGCGENGRRLT